MATNDFFTFCSEGSVENGDMLSIANYALDSERRTGYRPGLARRALINRALRQSSYLGTVLAQFIADTLDVDVKDDGDFQSLADKFGQAVEAYAAHVHQGEQGEQGPQGETGPQGPVGPQGPRGPAGPSGTLAGAQALSPWIYYLAGAR